MTELVEQLQARFPQLNFIAGRQFSWSPNSNSIIYKKNAKTRLDAWSLLHETGHALRAHTGYRSDFELLQLEVSAWDEAKRLGSDLGIKINEDHIQDCLDTYRNWLYRRSICPDCSAKCLQQRQTDQYRCFNCHKVWRVSASRFNRTYRLSSHTATHPMFI